MTGCFCLPSPISFRCRTNRKRREISTNTVPTSIEPVTSELRNWAELLPELICSISKRLQILDYFSFRAVCTSWASASKDSPQIAPSFPWLLQTKSEDVLTFFSYIDNKCFRLPAPSNIYHHSCKGSSQDGWLVMSTNDAKEVCIFNPLTGAAKINLPSVPVLPRSCSYVRKVIWPHCPSGSADIAAVICYGVYLGYELLAFARPGGEEWIPIPPIYNPCVRDIVFHKGKIAIISDRGSLTTVDSTGSSVEVNPDYGNKLFELNLLVSDPSGDLLMVQGSFSEAYFQVMKFNPAVESFWIEIKDLGEMSIFVDRYKAMLVSASDVPGVKGNCIYYASGYFKVSGEFVNQVGAFEIAKGVIKDDFCSEYSSFVDRRPPLWFTPSLL